tara:strand:- start:5254 stop:5595 length:342 start_codon:yes stop_codon:yes gene_type:complete
MATANFRSGSPVMADYTPAGAVTAGDVVVVDDVAGVAHVDIAAGALGALAVGGGIYSMTGDAAIVAGSKVWWDNATDKVTETAGALKIFGYVGPGSSCSGDGAAVDVVHSPSI